MIEGSQYDQCMAVSIFEDLQNGALLVFKRPTFFSDPHCSLLKFFLQDSESNPKFVTCERSYKKIGCYKEGFTNVLLVNDRDPTHHSYEGILIQWKDVGKSLHR